MTRREADLVAELAQESGRLEQQVMLGEDLDDPEAFLEELFQAWYELLAVRTMATHSSATYGRMARLVRFLPDSRAAAVLRHRRPVRAWSRAMADGQREFLHGVIEFYQTRTSTTRPRGRGEGRLAPACSRTTTCAGSPPGSRSSPSRPPSPASSARTCRTPASGSTAGVIVSGLLIVALAGILYVIFKRKEWF